MISVINLVPYDVSRVSNQMNNAVSLRYDTNTKQLQIIDNLNEIQNTISIDTTPQLQPEQIATVVNEDFIKNLGFVTEDQVTEIVDDKSKEYVAGNGILIDGDNNITIDQEFLEGFVANLGYIKVDNDTIYHADEITILMDGNNTFSISQSWLDNYLATKGYALATDIPTDFTTSAQVSEIVEGLSSNIIDGLATIGWVTEQGYITGIENNALLSDITITSIKVNGTTLTPTDKVVDISIPTNSDISGIVESYGFITGIENNALKSDIPTDLSAFTNGPGYVTENTTYSAGNGIDINEDNVISLTATIPTGLASWTSGVNQQYISSLGFVLVGDDKDTKYGVVQGGGLNLDTEHNFSIDATWIENKLAPYALINNLPTDLSAFTNGPGYVTENTTYTQGTGISINSGNIVEIDQEFLEGFVANLGYIKQDNDTLYHADENTIILTVEDGTEQLPAHNVFSVNTTWLDNYITDKGFATLTTVQEISGIHSNSIQSIHNQLTGYALKSELPITGVTVNGNSVVSSKVAAITVPTDYITGVTFNGSTATITNKVAVIEADYTTSAYVIGQVNALAEGAVLTNTNAIATIEANYTTSVQVSSIIEGYGFITGIENNALLSDIPTVPTNVSEFINDAGYLTGVDLTDYAQLSDIPVVPTKVSELNNDKSFVTLADLEAVKLSLLSQIGNMNTVIEIDTPSIGSLDQNLFVETSATLTANTTFTGKNITVTELNNENSYTNFTSTGDITISNVENSGILPKTSSNAQMSVNTPGRVVITDSNLSQNGYNAIEIGLASATEPPKSVLIDGITFAGNLSNNAISIFGTADDAVVTISNCTFTKVSNVLRLSNRTNTKVTVNFVNCQFTEWDTGAYAGIVICQDYTSQTAAMVEQNNLFAPDKVTINLINCTHAGTKIEFEDPSTVCATGDANQLLYVYADRGGGLVAYDASKFPTFTAV